MADDTNFLQPDAESIHKRVMLPSESAPNIVTSLTTTSVESMVSVDGLDENTEDCNTLEGFRYPETDDGGDASDENSSTIFPVRLFGFHGNHVESDNSFSVGIENKNTVRKTDTDMRAVIIYLRSINELRTPELIPPLELDQYLATYFSVVKKNDGKEYEPSTVRAILASIERYLRHVGYPASLTRDMAFAGTRDAMRKKQVELKRLSTRTTRPSALPEGASIEFLRELASQKIEDLYKAKHLGPFNPLSVINTLMFMFIVRFKMKKAVQHKALKWGDIHLLKDHTGKECLVYVPDHQDHNIGKMTEQERRNFFRHRVKIFAKPEKPIKNLVNIYKIYARKRPSGSLQTDSSFYLGFANAVPSGDRAWYKNTPMGVNKISDLVRQIRDVTYMSQWQPSIDVLGGYSDRALTDVLDPDETLSGSSCCTDPVGSLVHHRESISTDGEESIPVYDTDPESDDDLSYIPISYMIGRPQSSSNGHPQSNSDSPQHSSDNGHSSKITDSASDSPSTTQHIEADFSYNLDRAKSQLTNILQRLELHDLVSFDNWMKWMKISRDADSGQIVCRNGAEDRTLHGHPSETRLHGHPSETLQGASQLSNVTAATRGSNITLNITLTPESLRGHGPVTVVAIASPLDEPTQPQCAGISNLDGPSETIPDRGRSCFGSPALSTSRQTDPQHRASSESRLLGRQFNPPLHGKRPTDSPDGGLYKRSRLLQHAISTTVGRSVSLGHYDSITSTSIKPQESSRNRKSTPSMLKREPD